MKGPWMGDENEFRYKYNGIEEVDDFGVDLSFAAYRTLDPAIGRWLQVDPKGEAMYGINPYNSMFNNPITYKDPQGDFAFFAGLSNGFGDLAQGGNFIDGFGQGFTQSLEITAGIFQWNSDQNFGQNLGNIFSKITWELPQTIVGWTISQVLNGAALVNDVNYFRGATVLGTDITGGAFTPGSYIIGPAGFRPDFTDHLFVHEYGHYLQSKRFGPMYLNYVAIPSVIDVWIWPNRHDTRWYEAGASRLAANYFDREFGSGADGFVIGSPAHFDRNSFVTGNPSSYFNGRRQRSLGLNIRNTAQHPTNSRFHWSDILINFIL